MDEKELQRMVHENKSHFSMQISGKIFPIEEIELIQTDNPIMNQPQEEEFTLQR